MTATAGATPRRTASGRSITRASTTRLPGRSTCRARPQGRPVFVQAGSSDTGRRFAARHAEAVFTAHMEKATAQAFYADLKSLVEAEGRVPEQVLILPGLSPMIASTEAEAKRMSREINELSDPEVGRKRLSGRFGGHDFSQAAARPPAHAGGFPADPARSRRRAAAPKSSWGWCGGRSRRCGNCWRRSRARAVILSSPGHPSRSPT